MRTYEITYETCNTNHYPKRVTALVMEPDAVGPRTGAMLFTHGWGGSRFQNVDQMKAAVDGADVAAIAVEYRQSGFAFDPRIGQGWDVPYDLSFYQVVDVLNGLRTLLDLRPDLNRGRLFHYGVSQGGHIALLSTLYAPETFALVATTAALTHAAALDQQMAGRSWADWELSARNVIEHAAAIRTPLVLEHGTADPRVPHLDHLEPLVAKLEAAGAPHTVFRHEGGDHASQPVTTRLASFSANVLPRLADAQRETPDDFAAGRTVTRVCAGRTLAVDWSRAPQDAELVAWRDA